jgi:hypothetical protein
MEPVPKKMELSPKMERIRVRFLALFAAEHSACVGTYYVTNEFIEATNRSGVGKFN